MPIEPRVADRPHARPFSPSSADIALHCTKAVEFMLAGARKAPGSSAHRGNAQHEVFAWCWHRRVQPTTIPAVWVGGERIELTEQDHASIEFALEWLRPRFADRQVVIEKLLRAPWAGLFGYADLVAMDEPLTIVDLKFGWWPIHASSVQLGIYALLLALEAQRSIEGTGSIEAIVIQPRNPDPVRTHTWSFVALRDLRRRLLATYDRIRRQDFTYAVGGHCKWCPALSFCPALRAVALDAAAATTVPCQLVAGGEFDQATLDHMVELAPVFEALAKQTEALAKQYMLNGGRLKSRKLVKRRSGGVIAVDHSDPRPGLDVTAVFEADLRSLEASRLLK